MKIITISGTDGSGKTTQLKKLTHYLENKRKKVFHFHVVVFSLANKLASFLGFNIDASDNSGKAVTRAGWITIQLRKIFLVIDIFRFRLLIKKLKKQGYDYILSDRYFFDSFINVLYLERKRKGGLYFSLDEICPVLIWIEKLINKNMRPEITFYLHAPTHDILRQERIPEQGMQYIIDKQFLFGKYIPRWKMHQLDANQPVDQVFSEIKDLVILNERLE